MLTFTLATSKSPGDHCPCPLPVSVVLKRFGLCYGLNVCAPPTFVYGNLNPNVMGFGGELFEKKFEISALRGKA